MAYNCVSASSEVADRYNSAGIFFQTLTVSELSHRITYVDLVIELMLNKKLG